MKSQRNGLEVGRREFLTTTGAGLLASAIPAAASVAAAAGADEAPRPGASARAQTSSGSLRKIPIGVFDPVYDNLSLDEMLDMVSALGLEAMEIGTGGYPNSTAIVRWMSLWRIPRKQKPGRRNSRTAGFMWRH